MRRWLIRALVAVPFMTGAAFLGQSLWLTAKAEVAQVLLARAWDRARAGEVTPRPWPWADSIPAARLGNERLGIDQIVLADASPRSLAFGPGVIQGGGLPGADGHAALAGHRDSHFAWLRHLNAGDEIWAETASGERRRYRVAVTAIADSRSQALDLSPGGDARLTLVTCYPFDAVTPGGPLRYVVEALAEAPED
ncbi:MAG: class GN sortase [Rhodospirillales bacterium]